MIEPVNPDSLPPSKLDRAPASSPARLKEEDFTVHLDRVFHGPLDLLLQLVKDREVEIHLISLAQVCDDYCRHVRALPRVDVDVAADYLVVAATLIAIKSRALVPREEVEMEEDLVDEDALREERRKLQMLFDKHRRALEAFDREHPDVCSR